MKTPNSSTHLYRSETDRYLAGICGGIAEYFGLDSTLVRVLFITIILLGGSGLVVYFILWLVIPTKSENINNTKEMSMKTSSDKTNSTELNKKNKSLGGLFLIGIGLLMLLDNFGIGRYLMLEKTWPSIFIVLGLIILSR